MAWQQPTNVPVNNHIVRRATAAFIAVLATTTFAFVPPANAQKNWNEDIDLGKFQPKIVDYHYQKPQLSRAIQAGPLFEVTASWKENILLDKWNPEIPDIRFQRPGLAQAIQSGSLFWSTFTPAAAETILADKWNPEFPDLLLQKPALSRAIQSGSTFQDLRTSWREAVLLDKWAPELPDISFQRPALSRAIASGSLFYAPQEKILLDRWNPELPDLTPQRSTLSRAIQSGSFFFQWPVPAAGEVVTLDKWFRETEQPRFPSKNRAYITSPALPQLTSWKESVLLDKWQPEYPDVQFLRTGLPRAIQSGSSFYISTPIEVVTLDKWYQSQPQPFRLVRPRSLTELVIPVYFSTSTIVLVDIDIEFLRPDIRIVLRSTLNDITESGPSCGTITKQPQLNIIMKCPVCRIKMES